MIKTWPTWTLPSQIYTLLQKVFNLLTTPKCLLIVLAMCAGFTLGLEINVKTSLFQ